MATLESAIPSHLVVPRTQIARTPADFTPPYPSFSARFAAKTKRVVMAYFGVQCPQLSEPALLAPTLAELREQLAAEDGAGHVDRATYVDEAGFTTVLVIAYWDDPERYDRWLDSTPSWTRDERTSTGLGFFTEVLRPSVQRYETLFSNDRVEGVSRLADGLSGEVLEHAYWGGARDRMPLAQTDDLAPEGRPSVVQDGPRRRVTPQQNLCLIRSGQEWTETADEERRMYLEDVEPVLRSGMDFLRDDGLAIGCYSNRYVRLLDDDGQLTDRSFGMGWWRSMADLDSWAESHPTHVAIFGAAMRYLTTMGPAARLRLYHEITVAAAEEQSFVYLNCHDRTGMLRAATVG